MKWTIYTRRNTYGQKKHFKCHSASLEIKNTSSKSKSYRSFAYHVRMK